MKKYGNKSNNNYEILCKSLEEGSASQVSFLLSKGVDPNCRRARGFSMPPLYYAVGIANKHVVKVLLDAGADPNQADSNGETPLHEASRMGYKEKARLLLDAGAEPNKANSHGETPLLLAVRKVKKQLLHSGAKPNMAQHDGKAAINDDLGVVKLLMKAGAVLNKDEESMYSDTMIGYRLRRRYGQ